MSNRKQYSSEQKVSIVRRHLLENVPVSDLCDGVAFNSHSCIHSAGVKINTRFRLNTSLVFLHSRLVLPQRSR